MTLDENSIVARGTDNVAVEVDGELVMLDVEAGNYLGFSPVGTRIWEIISKPRTVSEVSTVLEHEYDVAPEVCRRETLAFLQQLADSGLLRTE